MKLAFIGCGDASAAMLLACRLTRGVRPAIFVDLNLERAQRLARFTPGAIVSREWRDVPDSHRADAAYVALPHSMHAEVATVLTAAGLPVLLEKPLAANLAEGRHIVEKLGASDLLGVNYQYRFDPRICEIRDAVRSGRLGELRYIDVRLPWYRTQRYFNAAPWHADATLSGGGTLLTQGSHGLDAALWICGDSPVEAFGSTYRRVFSETQIEDLATGVIETRSGMPIIITSSMISKPGSPMTVTAYGSRGSATYTASLLPRVRFRGMTGRVRVPTTRLQSYRLSLSAFAGWCAGGAAYHSTATDALEVLACVDALYRSGHSGRREKVFRLVNNTGEEVAQHGPVAPDDVHQ